MRNGLRLPVGTEVWLPRGTLERVAGRRRGAASNGVYYTVQPGDTLSGIAEVHGIGLSHLRQFNEIERGNSLIHVGQQLQLPDGATGPAERRHVVRRGETLGRIASSYGIGLTDLLSANTLTLRSIIHPGQVLQIPD